MRKELTGHLDPKLGLQDKLLQSYAADGEHIVEGLLQDETGYWYPIVNGVPCFLKGEHRPDLSSFQKRYGLTSCDATDDYHKDNVRDQAKTNVTFSAKWRKFREYGLQPNEQAFLQEWYCKKLGLSDPRELGAFYRDRQRILEVGPGSGFNARFMSEHSNGTVIAADISEAAFTTYGNTKHLGNCHVVQADLMNLPFPDEHFDFIIADGVLHHTPDTRRAVEALYKKLAPDGQFFFYVYKQMGPARVFCDQHIRDEFMKLSTEECFQACEPLTELGRELSKLSAKITLTKPIPVLGIPAGTHDVQRLLYYNFVKCFWNDAFDYDTNNMVNFDWYHPHNAWQHSQDEVEGWLKDLGVTEFSFQDANPNGLSVLLRKPQSGDHAAAA